jgi:hypothetical protein
MIIKKNLIRKITLYNAVDQFSPDMDNTILKIFNNNYAGKCLYGVYIISIDKIIKRSACSIINRSLDVLCEISVEVEASVIQYDTYELIIGKVVNVSSKGEITLTGSNYNINVPTDNYKMAQIDDNVPIYVYNCRYSPYNTTISIIGVPFIQLDYKNRIFKITEFHNENMSLISGKTNRSKKEIKLNNGTNIDSIYKPLFDMAEKWETKCKELSLNKDTQLSYKFFYKLISGDNNTKIPSNSLSKLITETELVSRGNAFHLYNAYKVEKSAQNNVNIIEEQSRFVIINLFLNAYIKELTTLYTLVNEYDNMELINKYHYIWNAYK